MIAGAKESSPTGRPSPGWSRVRPDYSGLHARLREGFRGKVERLFPGRGHAGALEVAGRIQHGVQSYVWVQTVVGLIIAGASALVMWPMGISHLMFWAFLIFMANYIPAIGAAIGVLLPPAFRPRRSE